MMGPARRFGRLLAKMVIIDADASKMAEGVRLSLKRDFAAPGEVGAPLAASKRPFDNKIEMFQRVLRHFLREIEGAGLGKS
jgi:hypothetical protein